MQTLLVLTDFSEPANYAASYACVLARQLDIHNIVVYHSYQAVIVPGEGVMYSGDENSLRQVAEKTLAELVSSLHEQVPRGIELSYRADTTLLEDINDIAIDEGAEMIVMGTIGKGKLEEMVAGSNAIRVCEASDYPVVLVPSHIPMQPVSNIIFACDLEEMEETIPGEKITNLLNTFHVPLSIVHVGKKSSNGHDQAPLVLDQLLQDHHPDYHELQNDDVATGILDFAKQQSSAIILLIAKKHGFPAGLFHRSITKQLAFQSSVPLLVLREKEMPEPRPVMPLLEI